MKAILDLFDTRLHSSRMHTARLLTVFPSMHCTGGGGGVSAPGGCLVSGWGYLVQGGGIPAYTEADPPL